MRGSKHAGVLASAFRADNEALIELVSGMDEREWARDCPGEGRSIGVVVQHIAEGHLIIGGIARAIAAGRPLPVQARRTAEQGAAFNERQARRLASGTRDDGLRILRSNTERVARFIERLGDEDLRREAVGVDGLTLADAIERGLIGHLRGHAHAVRLALTEGGTSSVDVDSDRSERRVPVLLLTGPPGVGKTAIALEVSLRLRAAGVAHAVVDLDALSWCFPAAPGDPYRTRLALRNLAALWPNFRAAGAERLVVARTIETRAEADEIAAAIPGGRVVVVRLHATPEALEARLRVREVGSGFAALLQRATDLTRLMDLVQLEDHLVETTGRSPDEVAREVLQLAWIDG